jgi:hypothetical protein
MIEICMLRRLEYFMASAFRIGARRGAMIPQVKKTEHETAYMVMALPK